MTALRAALDQTFSSLRIRNFRLYFCAQLISVSGTWMQSVAQAWLVLHLTGSGVALGIVVGLQFLPMLAFGPFGGLVADRVGKRRLLYVTQSAGGLLALVLGVLVVTHAVELWQIYLLATLLGVVNLFDNPARQTFMIEMVGRDDLPNAVSLNSVLMNASRVVGPAIGGVIITLFGLGVCFFVNAASYLPPLGVVVVLLWRRGWVRRPASEEDRGPGRVRQGLAFAWHHPAIRYTMLMAVAAGMLFNMGATLPLVATRAFDLGAGGYGAMMATFGAGAVFGALLAGAGPSWPSGRRVRGLAALTGAVVCLAAASPRVGLLFAGLALVGFLSIWFIALANALVQLRTSPELRGRVMGVWTMALPGATPITSLLVGGVATWSGGGAGAREAFGLSGAALLLTVALAWRSLSDRGQAAPSVMPVELGATTTAGQGLRAKV